MWQADDRLKRRGLTLVDRHGQQLTVSEEDLAAHRPGVLTYSSD